MTLLIRAQKKFIWSYQSTFKFAVFHKSPMTLKKMLNSSKDGLNFCTIILIGGKSS